VVDTTALSGARRKIADVEVSPIGLGGLLLSYAGRPDERQALAALLIALDAGVTLLDTADVYCQDRRDIGHNERLIARALSQWGGDRDDVLVVTKGGMTRGDDGSWGIDARPEQLRAACEASLRRLGAESIGLYLLHRPDPSVPYAESLGALRDLRAQGKVRHVGISNATIAQIDEARTVLSELACVENQFSPAYTSSYDELLYTAQLGIAFVAWSPLGGLSPRSVGDRPQPGTGVELFHHVAERHGVSVQRVALAWELAQAPNVIPIPAATRPQTLLDSLAAATLHLSDDELTFLGPPRARE
jgi:aryl-alcohol dehydrogenase-like predicted oxidoreductase